MAQLRLELSGYKEEAERAEYMWPVPDESCMRMVLGVYDAITKEHGYTPEQLLSLHEFQPEVLKSMCLVELYRQPELVLYETGPNQSIIPCDVTVKIDRLMRRAWVSWFCFLIDTPTFAWLREND
jgi:hypothetical protein